MPELQDLMLAIESSFKKRNQKKLRKINDRLLKLGVTDFNKSLYNLAVTSYVLSKIVSKPRFLEKKHEKSMSSIEKTLSKMSKYVDELSEEDWTKLFLEFEETISSLEKGDARFLTDLISKGKLKVASTLYAQGLSLGTAADYTGMSKQDILDYAGKTMMFDRVKEEKSILERIKIARNIILG
ncbi:hypothetical protein HYT84_02430 [Candidatus Micrarchaeota archaeon]|nr:hypothetical protein [Candidatus Micrarchaeota archaeon]